MRLGECYYAGWLGTFGFCASQWVVVSWPHLSAEAWLAGAVGSLLMSSIPTLWDRWKARKEKLKPPALPPIYDDLPKAAAEFSKQVNAWRKGREAMSTETGYTAGRKREAHQ